MFTSKLKKQFRYGDLQAMFGALAKIMTIKTADLEAKLSGVAGFTGYGEFEYASWANGDIAYEIELRGIAGTKADLYINAVKIATTLLINGRSDEHFDSRRGAVRFEAKAGDMIEVRQHGDVILQGILVND